MKRPYLNKAGFNKLAQSIKDYINRKITGYDKLGTASTKNFTTYVSPTQTEQLPISSSVYSAMTNMLRGAYHPAGSKTVAELTEDLLVKANLGNVYKITEDGITSDLFIGGAGQTIKTGDNAIVLYASEDTYKFSLESGVVDLDAYQKKELTTAIEGANTVEAALSALSNNKPTIKNIILTPDVITSTKSIIVDMLAKTSFTEGSFCGLFVASGRWAGSYWLSYRSPDALNGIVCASSNEVYRIRYDGTTWTVIRLVTESDIQIKTTKTSDEGTFTSRTFTLPSHANGDRYKISFSAQQYNGPNSYYGEWLIGFAGTGVTQVEIDAKGAVSASYNESTNSLTFVTDAQSSFGSIICEKIH